MNMSLHERNLIARLRDANTALSAADRNGLLTLIERLEQPFSAGTKATPDKGSWDSIDLNSAGLSNEQILELDKLLLDFREVVWEAGSNAWPPYDVASKDEAKAIQAHVGAMLSGLAAVSVAASEPACPACDVGVCSAHGPDQKMARKRVAAAPADAREPVATFDDWLKVYLDSWTGGRHEAGSFGEITLRFTDDRSTTIRDYRAKDIVPADPGDAAAFTNMWFTAIFRNVTRDEAQELVEHPKWSAGCWGHAFKQRDKALLERDKARTERDATRASLQIAEPVVTLNDAIAASDTLDIPLPTDTVEQTLELVNMCVARVRSATIEECATVCDELADNNTDSIKETGYLLANHIRSLASSPEPATPAEVATPEPLSDKGSEAISGAQVADQNAPAICVGCEGKPAAGNDPCAVCGKSSAPAISKIDDALMTAARQAVMALAHAAERYPQYQREYEELSNALDAALDEAARTSRKIWTPMPYIVPGEGGSDGNEGGRG
ncbi:hypothetical protein [Burkholderia glumae]|uniref:hypothetical protein n=1 Tax=Burkholderia glumae TaxID=337 RepID=UPI002150E26C|nr:hypothetical protein [Burkholderia glumae]